ncbi:MAG: hypothetical protein AABX38_03355 [Candidatus Micrarchaeota archaeon]
MIERKIKEFWSEEVTSASWIRLLELSKKYDFILIGGWSAYMWTKTHKSKDIDIVVNYLSLEVLKADFSLIKNERLAKYEIKQDNFDIDVYVSHYSKLALPVEILEKHTAKVEGITTVTPEILVILKQGAEIDRRGSIKGKKDQIDLLTLLIYSPFDFKKYLNLIGEFKMQNYKDELVRVVKEFNEKDISYLSFDHQEFIKWKKEFSKKL